MRTLAACLIFSLLLAAACGGKSAPAKQPDKPATPPAAAPSAFSKDYCDGYRPCAEENARMAAAGEGDGAAPDEAAITAAAASSVEDCLATTGALTAGQVSWLESCTGCGGSCDVYDCLSRIPSDAEPAPFECEMGN